MVAIFPSPGPEGSRLFTMLIPGVPGEELT